MKKHTSVSTVDKLIESMTPEEKKAFDAEYLILLEEERKLERAYNEGRARKSRVPDNTKQVSAETLPSSNT